MGLLGTKKKRNKPAKGKAKAKAKAKGKGKAPAKAGPGQAPDPAPSDPADGKAKAPARKKKKNNEDGMVQGYDLDAKLPPDAPLAVRLAQVLRKDPKRLKRLFISWAESEEGDTPNA